MLVTKEAATPRASKKTLKDKDQKAEVLFDYEARTETELTIKQGEIFFTFEIVSGFHALIHSVHP